MGWEPYQTVDPLEKEPQVCRGLFGVRLLILHFKIQFFKSIKSSTFHIFLNLTYPLRKKISFTECPEIIQKFTQNRKTLVNVLNGAIWHCLKRERDIGTKTTLSDKNSLQVKPRLKVAVTRSCVAFLLCNQWRFNVPGINAKVNGSQY